MGNDAFSSERAVVVVGVLGALGGEDVVNILNENDSLQGGYRKPVPVLQVRWYASWRQFFPHFMAMLWAMGTGHGGGSAAGRGVRVTATAVLRTRYGDAMLLASGYVSRQRTGEGM